MASVTQTGVGRRPRDFVAVRGRDAISFLQRMVSNDVEALAVGDACEALLLTAKARVIAPLVVWRRGDDDVLLLTEPDLGEVVRAQLLRARFAAKAELEVERHVSHVVLGGEEGIANREYGAPAVEVLDSGLEPDLGDSELELLRIEAGTPRWGHEIDGTILPAEAGLTERAVSFTKGCYPGQEPIARLHYRGHANRGLRRLVADAEVAEGDEVTFDGRAVGRVSSVAARPDGSWALLAFVRREVPDDAAVAVGPAVARPLDSQTGRP